MTNIAVIFRVWDTCTNTCKSSIDKTGQQQQKKSQKAKLPSPANTASCSKRRRVRDVAHSAWSPKCMAMLNFGDQRNRNALF
ncbi:hypothetical protein L596_027105 [Steinernema carpocapsae]|uniref:Uncharacterized protein n=1 Tax=Steinernema carpocapsae TaxID=34508 RepID=A0A4U5M3C7_STECR|nr:hypothetical protein L596_027105 [Steinernema carpocapsae]